MKPAEFAPFELRGGYHLFRIIGKGEFGRVYLATDRNKFEVAVKEISKADLRSSRKRQELFETERTILTKVRNENVVRLYECIETPEHHYLVMQYCKHGDLHDFIKAKPGGTLSQEEAMDILIQILNGFKGLHDILVIHRDIKLRNILVAENDRIKIADFGLSKISEEGVATTIVGTPYTKAPEVFSGKRYDNRADIWSLGIIFYQMLFKLSYPYTAKNEKALFEGIKQGKSIDFHAHGITISPEVENLIRRMLTPQPKKRITWKELGDDKLIQRYVQKSGVRGDPTKVLNSDYYEKIERYLDEYNELNDKILIMYETLLGLQKIRDRSQKFCTINTVFYEFLLVKNLKTLFGGVREVIHTCLEISSIKEALNEQQLKLQEEEIQNYYEQALFNLEVQSNVTQVFLLERPETSTPELQREMESERPNPRLFQEYTLRLYQILEKKLALFEQAPILQKVTLEQMRNIMFTLQGHGSGHADTVEGLRQLNQELYVKYNNM